MQPPLELLACPACGASLSYEWRCNGCGMQFQARDGIPALRLPADHRTEAVRRMYEANPFPGYPTRDSLAQLEARAGRSAFAQLLDRSIPGDARVADVGCGTGQMSLYLAHGDRIVVGADLTRAALMLGAAAARRYRIARVSFVETDLRRPGLRAGAFDVVLSSGVLHHTPHPRRAFAPLAQLVRPGGFLVVGVYNAVARLPSRLRRLAVRAARRHAARFDPVLRDGARDTGQYAAWLQDQYFHPEEHAHTLREVQSWFAENDIEYLRAYPSTVLDDEPGELFVRAADDWSVEAWLAQVQWMWTLGGEGGLFFTIGRRT